MFNDDVAALGDFDDLLGAYKAAVQAWSPLLFARVKRLGLQHCDTQDVVQEAIIRLLGRWEHLSRPGEEPLRWLHRVAFNLAIDVRRNRLELVPEGYEAVAGGDGAPGEIETALLQALRSTLTDLQFGALALMASGRTSEEAAAALGKKPGLVRSAKQAGIPKARLGAFRYVVKDVLTDLLPLAQKVDEVISPVVGKHVRDMSAAEIKAFIEQALPGAKVLFDRIWRWVEGMQRECEHGNKESWIDQCIGAWLSLRSAWKTIKGQLRSELVFPADGQNDQNEKVRWYVDQLCDPWMISDDPE